MLKQSKTRCKSSRKENTMFNFVKSIIKRLTHRATLKSTTSSFQTAESATASPDKSATLDDILVSAEDAVKFDSTILGVWISADGTVFSVDYDLRNSKSRFSHTEYYKIGSHMCELFSEAMLAAGVSDPVAADAQKVREKVLLSLVNGAPRIIWRKPYWVEDDLDEEVCETEANTDPDVNSEDGLVLSRRVLTLSMRSTIPEGYYDSIINRLWTIGDECLVVEYLLENGEEEEKLVATYYQYTPEYATFSEAMTWLGFEIGEPVQYCLYATERVKIATVNGRSTIVERTPRG